MGSKVEGGIGDLCGGMVWEGRVSWGGFGCVDRGVDPVFIKDGLGWDRLGLGKWGWAWLCWV